MKQTDFLEMNVPELSDKADITRLSDNMKTIDNAISMLTTSKTSMTQRVTALEAHDTVLDNQISSINGNVSNLTSEVNKFNSFFTIETV